MEPCHHTTHAALERMPMHRHRQAYAALVLDGGYHEMSIDGRYACEAGLLVVHPPWHAHANEFGHGGAVVLNLPVQAADGFSAVTVSAAQAIARLAEQDPVAAGNAAMEEARARAPEAPAHWLARLTALLVEGPERDIADIAGCCGVTPAHASRACKRWFGAGPVALRREGRLRYAIELLSAGTKPAEAAAAAGFSDQPHLTRLLKRATGLTPAKLPAR